MLIKCKDQINYDLKILRANDVFANNKLNIFKQLVLQLTTVNGYLLGLDQSLVIASQFLVKPSQSWSIFGFFFFFFDKLSIFGFNHESFIRFHYSYVQLLWIDLDALSLRGPYANLVKWVCMKYFWKNLRRMWGAIGVVIIIYFRPMIYVLAYSSLEKLRRRVRAVALTVIFWLIFGDIYIYICLFGRGV